MDAKVNQFGQISIPEEIQKKLGILPGSQVELEVVSGALIVRKKSTLYRADDGIKQIRGKAAVSLTAEEILKITHPE